MMRCEACNTDIMNNNCIKCTRCNKQYHTLCINLSDEDLQNEKNSNKWLCPHCRSKQPKGDNSNTPVRPSTPTSMADITFNVTRRKVNQARTEPQQIASLTTESWRQEIRDIIREEIRDALQTTVGALTSTLTANLREINEEMKEFKVSMNFLNSEFEKLKDDNTLYRKEINQMRKENEMLRSELTDTRKKYDQIDQSLRANNVEIQCVPENKTEKLLNVVKQLGRAVNVSINENDIQYCSRIAKMKPDSIRPRSILIKFNTSRLRDNLLAAVGAYNRTHVQDKLNTHDLGFTSNEKSPVFVVENLSPENKNLHAAARIRAKELKYKFIWVRGGRIYMRKNETADKIFIRNLDMLNKLT
uniref:SFRICE_028235 n=1 Tax=Spodoptera frugiperda TaxID=7108 RepID=A0A2H1W956_SPOFR